MQPKKLYKTHFKCAIVQSQYSRSKNKNYLKCSIRN